MEETQEKCAPANGGDEQILSRSAYGGITRARLFVLRLKIS